MPKTINNLVLSGGGVKGLATCGALKRLIELSDASDDVVLDIKNILGVSIGAVIGFLYVIGYTPTELIDILYKKDFNDLISISLRSIFSYYGVDTGDSLLTYIKELALKKGVKGDITFSQLYQKNNIKLQVNATNLTKKCQTTFDYTSYPDLSVLQAIRMSFSIPFVFSCVHFEDCVYIDGGLSDNYPIEMYDHDKSHTFGIQLVADNKGMSSKSFQLYVSAIISCLQSQLEDKCESGTTLNINANVASPVSFDISLEQKKDLVFLGYSNCTRFFDSKSK